MYTARFSSGEAMPNQQGELHDSSSLGVFTRSPRLFGTRHPSGYLILCWTLIYYFYLRTHYDLAIETFGVDSQIKRLLRVKIRRLDC